MQFMERHMLWKECLTRRSFVNNLNNKEAEIQKIF